MSISPSAIQLHLPPPMRHIHQVFQVSHVKTLCCVSFQTSSPSPASPRLMEGDPAYTSRRLLDARFQGQGCHLKVFYATGQRLLSSANQSPQNRNVCGKIIVANQPNFTNIFGKHAGRKGNQVADPPS